MSATESTRTSSEARAALYGALGRIFLPLDRAASREAAGDTVEAAAALGRDLVGLAQEMAAAADGAPLVERADRVLGHAAGTVHPPYGAEYGAAGDFQHAQTLADIAGFYAAWGVEVDAEAHERVDHLGVEAEFMGLLASREAHAESHGDASAAAACRAAACRFLEDHLGAFAATFAARLSAAADDPFFTAAARLLERLVAADAERLGARPRRPLVVVDAPPPQPDGGTTP